MIILGLDPGVATVGFGIIQAEGHNHKKIACGAITTPAGLPLARRLEQVYEDTKELISTFKPDAIAIEELFLTRILRQALPLPMAAGCFSLRGSRRAFLCLSIRRHRLNRPFAVMAGRGSGRSLRW